MPTRPNTALRAASIAAVLLVLAVCVACVAVAHVDAGFLKTRLEAAVLRGTGRQLTVAGPIRLSLLPSPGFVAQDVTLANIPGGSRPAMAQAEAVAATLDLAPLLRGRVVVRSLVLTGAQILVERTADGRPNWVFAPERTAQAPTAAATSRPAAPRLKLTVASLDINGGTLAWNNVPAAGEAGHFAIRHLAAQQHDAASSFTLFLDGRHDATPFSLSLASRAPAELAAASATRPFPLRATLRIGDGDAADELGLDGQWSDPLHARGFAGTVHARLRALADLDGLFPHADLPRAEALHATARVAQGASGAWRVASLDAATGATDAGRWLPGLALTRLTAAAAGPDAPLVVHAAGTLRGQPFTLDAPAFAALDLPNGAHVDAAATLAGAHLRLHGALRRYGDMGPLLEAATDLATPDLAASLAAFGIRLDRPVAIAVQGSLKAAVVPQGRSASIGLQTSSFTVDGAAMPPSLVLFQRAPALRKLDILRLDVPGSPRWLDLDEDFAAQPADLSITLDGHLLPAAAVLPLVAGTRGVAGGLDVTAHLHAPLTDGRLDPALLDGSFAATVVDGTITHALLAPTLAATHLPLGTGGAEHVRCAGVAGQAAAGVVTLSSLSLDSRMLAVDGDGTVALPGGALALHLRPTVRLGIAAASAPIAVGGTLADPHPSLAHDAQGRVALSIGQASGPGTVTCDANPDVAALPAARAKAPKPMDILRGLGLFR